MGSQQSCVHIPVRPFDTAGCVHTCSTRKSCWFQCPRPPQSTGLNGCCETLTHYSWFAGRKRAVYHTQSLRPAREAFGGVLSDTAGPLEVLSDGVQLRRMMSSLARTKQKKMIRWVTDSSTCTSAAHRKVFFSDSPPQQSNDAFMCVCKPLQRVNRLSRNCGGGAITNYKIRNP